MAFGCRIDHAEQEKHFDTNPILDPIRFLVPIEAGWGAVPLVGEACDQPGGISLGCGDGVAKGWPSQTKKNIDKETSNLPDFRGNR